MLHSSLISPPTTPSFLTHIQLLIAAKIIFVVYIEGADAAGISRYAYVAVRGDNMGAFKKAQGQRGFAPSDHGIILASGQGKPTKDQRDHMQEEFGFVHQEREYMEN